jgi:hypothetical protein
MNRKTLMGILTSGVILAAALGVFYMGDEVGGAKGMYLTVAVEGLVATTVSMQRDGDLPASGADFIDATLMYAGAVCGILSNPTLDPAQKRAALAVDLVDEQAAFNKSVRVLLYESDIDPGARAFLAPAIGAARAAARVAITEELPPEAIEGPCRSMQYIAASWTLQQRRRDN